MEDLTHYEYNVVYSVYGFIVSLPLVERKGQQAD